MNCWNKIIQLNTVDSTNNYVSNILKREKLEEGSIIFTHHQTAGKGQANNSWESQAGQNILMSIVLYPHFIEIANQFSISKAISLGIINYCSNYIEKATIKWPNDIFYKNKKLAGILIENTLKGKSLERSIIGIGININQEDFSDCAPNAVSLKQITGNEFNINNELVKLRNSIKLYYEKLKNSPQLIHTEYLSKMFRFEENHAYKVDSEILEGKIIGVNEFGHLQLETTQHEIKEFDLKEIEFII